MSTPAPDGVPVEPWDAFAERVSGSIADAEAHLGLLKGTLADVFHDSDYLATLKIYATVEPLLNELLEMHVTRTLSHPKVHFPGGDTLAEFVLNRNLTEKRKLALKFELITEKRSRFILCIADVRNHFAHNIKNFSLSILDVAKKLSPSDDGKRIIDGLSGVKIDPSFF
jgi:hypothetical protein